MLCRQFRITNHHRNRLHNIAGAKLAEVQRHLIVCAILDVILRHRLVISTHCCNDQTHGQILYVIAVTYAVGVFVNAGRLTATVIAEVILVLICIKVHALIDTAFIVTDMVCILVLVAQCGNLVLSNQNFITYGAVRAFGQAGRGTGSRNRCIGGFRVTQFINRNIGAVQFDLTSRVCTIGYFVIRTRCRTGGIHIVFNHCSCGSVVMDNVHVAHIQHAIAGGGGNVQTLNSLHGCIRAVQIQRSVDGHSTFNHNLAQYIQCLARRNHERSILGNGQYLTFAGPPHIRHQRHRTGHDGNVRQFGRRVGQANGHHGIVGLIIIRIGTGHLVALGGDQSTAVQGKCADDSTLDGLTVQIQRHTLIQDDYIAVFAADQQDDRVAGSSLANSLSQSLVSDVTDLGNRHQSIHIGVLIAVRTSGTGMGGITLCIEGRCGHLCFVIVAEHGSIFLSNQDFTTNGAVRTFGQAGCDTGSRNCLIDHCSVAQGIYGHIVTVAFRILVTCGAGEGLNARRRTGGVSRHDTLVVIMAKLIHVGVNIAMVFSSCCTSCTGMGGIALLVTGRCSYHAFIAMALFFQTNFHIGIRVTVTTLGAGVRGVALCDTSRCSYNRLVVVAGGINRFSCHGGKLLTGFIFVHIRASGTFEICIITVRNTGYRHGCYKGHRMTQCNLILILGLLCKCGDHKHIRTIGIFAGQRTGCCCTDFYRGNGFGFLMDTAVTLTGSGRSAGTVIRCPFVRHNCVLPIVSQFFGFHCFGLICNPRLRIKDSSIDDRTRLSTGRGRFSLSNVGRSCTAALAAGTEQGHCTRRVVAVPVCNTAHGPGMALGGITLDLLNLSFVPGRVPSIVKHGSIGGIAVLRTGGRSNYTLNTGDLLAIGTAVDTGSGGSTGGISLFVPHVLDLAPHMGQLSQIVCLSPGTKCCVFKLSGISGRAGSGTGRRHGDRGNLRSLGHAFATVRTRCRGGTHGVVAPIQDHFTGVRVVALSSDLLLRHAVCLAQFHTGGTAAFHADRAVSAGSHARLGTGGLHTTQLHQIGVRYARVGRYGSTADFRALVTGFTTFHGAVNNQLKNAGDRVAIFLHGLCRSMRSRNGSRSGQDSLTDRALHAGGRTGGGTGGFYFGDFHLVMTGRGNFARAGLPCSQIGDLNRASCIFVVFTAAIFTLVVIPQTVRGTGNSLAEGFAGHMGLYRNLRTAGLNCAALGALGAGSGAGGQTGGGHFGNRHHGVILQFELAITLLPIVQIGDLNGAGFVGIVGRTLCAVPVSGGAVLRAGRGHFVRFLGRMAIGNDFACAGLPSGDVLDHLVRRASRIQIVLLTTITVPVICQAVGGTRCRLAIRTLHTVVAGSGDFHAIIGFAAHGTGIPVGTHFGTGGIHYFLRRTPGVVRHRNFSPRNHDLTTCGAITSSRPTNGMTGSRLFRIGLLGVACSYL